MDKTDLERLKNLFYDCVLVMEVGLRISCRTLA